MLAVSSDGHGDGRKGQLHHGGARGSAGHQIVGEEGYPLDEGLVERVVQAMHAPRGGGAATPDVGVGAHD